MMKRILKFALIASIFTSLVNADEYKAVVNNKLNKLEIHEDEGVLSVKSIPATDLKKNQVSSYARALIDPQNSSANAISFEYKGDGSDFYASVFLGEKKNLLDAYEAVFPLKSTEWQKRTILISEFARNAKPWNPTDLNLENTRASLNALKFIGFGRGFKYHRYNHPDFSFQIRNIKFVQAPEILKLPLKKGIPNFLEKLKANQSVKILLIGDSITEHGKDLSHTYHGMKQLGKEAEVFNAAIGGHSSRCGEIVLERSVGRMPKPDLIVLMYGANDCKLVTSPQLFESHLMNTINKLNRLTDGNSEFLLINGVPRLEKGSMQSKEIVEKITPAYDLIAQKHGLLVVDSMSAFLALNEEDKKQYYKDTIHQTQEGQKFIGRLISKTIKEQK